MDHQRTLNRVFAAWGSITAVVDPRSTSATQRCFLFVEHPRSFPVDAEESHLTVGRPAYHAAGLKAVKVSMTRALKQMGMVKTARTC